MRPYKKLNISLDQNKQDQENRHSHGNLEFMSFLENSPVSSTNGKKGRL